MPYEARGIIKQVQPVQSGNANGKEWAKMQFLIEIPDPKYPKEVAFTAWNKTIAYLDTVGEGSEVNIHFEASSREWDGKYFTDLTAFKIETINKVEPKAPAPIESGIDTDVNAQLVPADGDLPF